MPSILSVGQCGYDHSVIARQLLKSVGAEVVPASSFAEALTTMRGRAFELVLVNRVTDRDGTLGVNLIRTLKGDPAIAAVPVMLVSNFPAAQAEAEQAGALPGFGKADLGSTKVLERIRAVLGLDEEAAKAR